ncbi:hypothetical protein N7467_003866 [Penicillium canescens]|nr:hypothetical protein N7467_003866 [Penicillium canescens]
MIQVVGLVQIIPCRHCLQRDGPWAHCVVAPGATHCGNCHWGGNSFRCSFGPGQRMPPRRTRRPIGNAQAPDPAHRQRLATLRANMVVIEGYIRQVWDHVTTLTEICYLMLSSDPVERSQVRQLLAELTVLNRRLREAQNAYQDLVNSYQDLVETLLAVIETL